MFGDIEGNQSTTQPGAAVGTEGRRAEGVPGSQLHLEGGGSWRAHRMPPIPSPAQGPHLTRSRPRSSSLSCRCDKDKVPSC